MISETTSHDSERDIGHLPSSLAEGTDLPALSRRWRAGRCMGAWVDGEGYKTGRGTSDPPPMSRTALSAGGGSIASATESLASGHWQRIEHSPATPAQPTGTPLGHQARSRGLVGLIGWREGERWPPPPPPPTSSRLHLGHPARGARPERPGRGGDRRLTKRTGARGATLNNA
jgi:hypothetical protein